MLGYNSILSLLYISYIPDVICTNATYTDAITTYANRDCTSCQPFQLASELESDLQVDWGKRWFHNLSTDCLPIDRSNNSGA